MAQQTQVARVAERFEPFMRRFPNPRAMARSSERDVLTHWQGLGYYRRALLLRRAAIEIASAHRGRVPRRAEALERLPGVGRYTAGAVASIVHGERVPIVDGNAARVILRLLGERRPLRDPGALRLCWDEARRLVDACGDPARFNEGLMELGALVCTPASPKCAECPVRSMCRARAEGATDRIPAGPRRKARRRVVIDACIVERGGRVLLERRGGDGMWAGLWRPPSFESAAALPRRSLRAALAERLAIEAARIGREIEPVGEFAHRTTHRDFRVVVHRVSLRGAITRRRDRAWAAPPRVDGHPLSTLDRRILAMAADQATARRGPGVG